MANDDIQGTVTDADGNAVGGAIVALWNQDNPNNVVTTTADSNGNYVFNHHSDGDGTSTNWHLTARDPNDGTRQFPSLHSVSAQVVRESAVFRWTFDDTDTESGAAIDVWNDNDATINGVTTGVSGANQTYTTNEAYEFDRSGGNVDSSVSDIATASVAAWAKITYTDSTDRVVIGTLDSDTGFALRYAGQTNAVWDLVTANDGSFSTVVGSNTTFEWIHFVAVLDDNNSITLYEDGSEVGTTSIGSRDLGGTFRVGERSDGGNHFDGPIDDVRVYNKALSSSEVSNLYNTGSIDG